MTSPAPYVAALSIWPLPPPWFAEVLEVQSQRSKVKNKGKQH